MLQEQPRLWTVLLQRSPSPRAREVALISAAPCCISFTPIFPSEVEKPRELHLQAEKRKSELPSKPYPSELGSAPRWSSTCTHSGLRGAVQEGDVPGSSGCSQTRVLPTLCPPQDAHSLPSSLQKAPLFKQICSLCSILQVKL